MQDYESEFRYGNGLSHADFNFPSFVPAFFDEANATLKAEAETICNNTQCIFDYAVTGNRELALETTATEVEAEERKVIASKNRT